ncbi:MAG: hypothetical protein KUG77_12065 [Nannocystaceae bacterium]|nr:hypothetical protein [Nannocystaceae bacterium]
MQLDASRLPSELQPFVEALDFFSCDARPGGWRSPDYPAAPFEPLRPGAPPFDGVYRASWISKGVAVRFDLDHASVPASLRGRLRRAHPEHLGKDHALYLYGVDTSSQPANVEAIIEPLWLMVVDS